MNTEEKQDKFEIVKLENGNKILTHVRTFTTIRDFKINAPHDLDDEGYVFRAGDMFEEKYSHPNLIKRVGTDKAVGWNLDYINATRTLRNMFEQTGEIDVKESEMFLADKKKLWSRLKRKLNAREKMNQNIEELRYLLEED